jgi:hypothetical protein
MSPSAIVRAAVWIGFVALFSWALCGCGAVTVSQNDVDAGAGVDAGVDVAHVVLEAGTTRELDAGNTDLQAEAAAPSCSSIDDGCAACATAAGVDGVPYASAAQCRAVVDCVIAGDAGAYPLQSCHNLAGGGADYGGLHCAQALLERACPNVAR